MGERTEFFRSGDEWCRPVNFTTGPDGAIYVCDIYRRWIDHARFFPEEFVKAHDMREGEHQGRIWRIVPTGTKAPPPLAKASATALPEHPARQLFLSLQSETNADKLAAAINDYPEDPWMAKMVALLVESNWAKCSACWMMHSLPSSAILAWLL